MFRKACLPDIRYKDTKNGKSLDRIYKKVSIKYRNKKTSKLILFIEPLATASEKPKGFSFFTCIKFLLPENQSFFLPLKNKLQLPIK